ncbi:MAG: alpha/beta fold hydrolase [Proteobacteria bacterium]|nr:alpha/beta fold hydrolase [Pseudomonadota bacterium]
MSAGAEPAERQVEVNGLPCRVWEKGPQDAAPIGYLAGLVGLPRWTPFLDLLAQERRVVAPSLPGFPGATGHEQLDTLLDWVHATLELLEAAGLRGADLMGVSVGGTLAAEVAATAPDAVRKLVLLAPFGLFDEQEPVTDIWAQRPGAAAALFCSDVEKIQALLAVPEGEDPVEWQILQARASEAAARILWPTTDTGLAKRLHRIRCDTLLVWGSADAIVPASTAKRIAAGLSGKATVRSIAGAGHLADLDAPEAVSEAVRAFLG